MFLVFAGQELTRNAELIYGNLECDEETDYLNYDTAEWKDIEADILLGDYEVETAKEAIEKAAKEYETDKELLYAIEVNDNYKKITYE